ncbi:cellulose-binding domain-containing protein [Microbispora bryophytorum]|uniref:cellulose-binding domain-containing protein n=1 Tax=Microbispora bryophytorum TaxID=1460882 RepID=UPI001CC2A25E|nr:cellulose-binding domain-containing protein [Microbispora camponoti]
MSHQAVAGAAAAGCRVDYTVTSQWPGGFTGAVTVTNLGDPVSGWKLAWSFTAGQTVTQAWNATLTQNGAQVIAADAGYNAALATGGSTAFGFNGSWNNSANPPSPSRSTAPPARDRRPPHRAPPLHRAPPPAPPPAPPRAGHRAPRPAPPRARVAATEARPTPASPTPGGGTPDRAPGTCRTGRAPTSRPRSPGPR